MRSVNGRFLDLALRLPDEFRALEPALRELLTAAFQRGKIELRLTARRRRRERLAAAARPSSSNRLARLESTVRELAAQGAAPLSVHEVLQWCRGARAAASGSTRSRWRPPGAAVDGLREARAREGERLVAMLIERVERLRELAAAGRAAGAGRRRSASSSASSSAGNEALEATGAAQTISREALQERALNEAAAYAIRIDVAEELARLRSHLDEIARLLDKGGEVGKRLDFLIQELLREANTLGSKSTALELTDDLGRDEGRDRAAARAGAEHRVGGPPAGKTRF